MNDRQIRGFLMICEEGSMNRAAERLFVSQPALKKRMDALEAELGVVLLKRGSEGCEPTAAGRLFAEEMREISERVARAAERVRRAGQQKTLRVCTLPDISMREQDELLIDFERRFPDVRIERVLLPTEQWMEEIAAGRADLCSCYGAKSEKNIRTDGRLCYQVYVKRVRLICILSSEHPLAQRQRIAPEDLRGERVCTGPLLGEFSGLREFAQRKGFAFQCDFSAGKRYEMIKGCEEGTVYLHPDVYARELRPMKAIPLTGFSCSAGWVWRRDVQETVQRFLDFCASQG